ncbi:IS21-like element helper ATPase IstB [Desulfobacterium sp. N47]
MLNNLLLELNMQGAVAAYEKLNQTTTDKELLMIQLLEAELQHRKDKSMKRRLQQARFPVEKEWVEIDPALNPKIDFRRIEKLFDGNFLEIKQNLCFAGLQGTGKTHSLIALGRQLCRKGKTVRFYTACGLVNALEEAKHSLTLGKLMNTLLIPKLLIIDELGFVPFSENGSRLLFDVFASRYERGSIAVSTNLSFEKWVQVFGSVELTAALVDRFTHKAEIMLFEGDSVRLMQTKNKKSCLINAIKNPAC